MVPNLYQLLQKKKKDHIRAVAAQDEVAAEWLKAHGESITEQQIDAMYDAFSELLLESIEVKSDLIPGVLDAVSYLQERGVKIGASTGYFKQSADIVASKAAGNNYLPDFTINSSEVPAGRPWPWMINTPALMRC